MSKKGTIPGILIGGAIGAVSALLLAPKSGKNLRSDLSDRYTTVAGKTAEVASTVKDKAVDVASTVKDKAVDVASNVGHLATELRDSVINKSSVVVDAAKDTVDSAKVTADLAKDVSSEIVEEAKDKYKSNIDNGNIKDKDSSY